MVQPADRSHLEAVTVEQLLARPPLRDATLLGGATGLKRPVRDVVVRSARDRPGAEVAMADMLIVIDASEQRSDSYLVDIALRVADQSGASALLLCSPPAQPALAAVRLADKLGLPLITSSSPDPLAFSDAVRRLVTTPVLVRSEILLAVLDDLRRSHAGASLEVALAQLAERLDGTISLIGSGGTVLAGGPLEGIAGDGLEDRSTVLHEAGRVDVIQPLKLAPRERATFWLVCRLDRPAAHWRSMVVDTLGVAAWYVSARLVADRLQRERDARFRMGVLNAIVATTEEADATLLRDLGVLGWRFNGWCTGIHVIASGDLDSLGVLTLTDELTRALEAVGVRGAVVERSDGWSLWLVDDSEPPAKAYAPLVSRLRTATAQILDGREKSQIHVGVGRPYHGLSGLRESLSEAHEAATIARAGGGQSVVRHIDEMGLRRILLGWYASESFAELARTLLAPVLKSERADELVETLETYLDCESSATMAAARMRLHRNTVINRIERLRSLLTVDLEDPDERLAVQLACRVIKLERDGANDRS